MKFLRVVRLIPRAFTGWKRLLASGLVVAVAGSLGVFISLLSPERETPVSAAPPPQPTTVSVPTPEVPLPDAQRLRTCVVPQPTLPEGSALHATVVQGDTGETLWSVEPNAVATPASVMKILTARAALTVLGPDYRFRTSMVLDPPNNRLVLIGGGDATLTRLPEGGRSYYPGAAHLETLLDRAVAALGPEERDSNPTLVLDLSRYAGFPVWDDSWRPGAERLGFVAPVTAFQLDGDRDDPTARISERSSDPIARALPRLQEGLATRGIAVQSITAESRAVARVDMVALATVSSAPVSDLVVQMLRDSDNQLAEMLLRETAVVAGVSTFEDALRLGLPEDRRDTTDLVVRDGSGLSPLNRVSSALVVDLLVDVSEDPRFAPVLAGLPRPGEEGSLARRFAGSVAAESVRAKTGTLSGVRSLAGIVGGPEDALVFSVMISGPLVDDAERAVIDRLVSDWFACGENLAHWN